MPMEIDEYKTHLESRLEALKTDVPEIAESSRQALVAEEDKSETPLRQTVKKMFEHYRSISNDFKDDESPYFYVQSWQCRKLEYEYLRILFSGAKATHNDRHLADGLSWIARNAPLYGWTFWLIAGEQYTAVVEINTILKELDIHNPHDSKDDYSSQLTLGTELMFAQSVRQGKEMAKLIKMPDANHLVSNLTSLLRENGLDEKRADGLAAQIGVAMNQAGLERDAQALREETELKNRINKLEQERAQGAQQIQQLEDRMQQMEARLMSHSQQRRSSTSSESVLSDTESEVPTVSL